MKPPQGNNRDRFAGDYKHRQLFIWICWRIRRPERTKSAILAAARAAFTEKGYENTTIRAIAAAAEVDPALVMRSVTAAGADWALVGDRPWPERDEDLMLHPAN